MAFPPSVDPSETWLEWTSTVPELTFKVPVTGVVALAEDCAPSSSVFTSKVPAPMLEKRSNTLPAGPKLTLLMPTPSQPLPTMSVSIMIADVPSLKSTNPAQPMVTVESYAGCTISSGEVPAPTQQPPLPGHAVSSATINWETRFVLKPPRVRVGALGYVVVLNPKWAV